METQAQNVLEYSENSGPLFSGLVCHSLQPPVAQVCEMEARSTCHGNECLQSRLAGPPRLHFPTICSVMEVPSEDEKEREHCGTDSSSLASSGVVSSPTGVSDGRSPTATQVALPADKPLRQQPSTNQSGGAPASHMKCQGTVVAGLLQQAADLLVAGWSQGTNTAYNSGCRRWSYWCESRHVDPFQEALLRFHGGVYLLRVSSKGPLIAVIQLSP